MEIMEQFMVEDGDGGLVFTTLGNEKHQQLVVALSHYGTAVEFTVPLQSREVCGSLIEMLTCAMNRMTASNKRLPDWQYVNGKYIARKDADESEDELNVQD